MAASARSDPSVKRAALKMLCAKLAHTSRSSKATSHGAALKFTSSRPGPHVAKMEIAVCGATASDAGQQRRKAWLALPVSTRVTRMVSTLPLKLCALL